MYGRMPAGMLSNADDIRFNSIIHPSVHLGVSPRGSISLMKAAQAYALLHDRDYVIPDDVQYLAPYTRIRSQILDVIRNDVIAVMKQRVRLRGFH